MEVFACPEGRGEFSMNIVPVRDWSGSYFLEEAREGFWVWSYTAKPPALAESSLTSQSEGMNHVLELVQPLL